MRARLESTSSIDFRFQNSRPESGSDFRFRNRVKSWICAAHFHRAIEELPEEPRQIFDLFCFHGLKQEEAAEFLKVAVRTVKRRWRAARLALHERLGGLPAFEL